MTDIIGMKVAAHVKNGKLHVCCSCFRKPLLDEWDNYINGSVFNMYLKKALGDLDLKLKVINVLTSQHFKYRNQEYQLNRVIEIAGNHNDLRAEATCLTVDSAQSVWRG